MVPERPAVRVAKSGLRVRSRPVQLTCCYVVYLLAFVPSVCDAGEQDIITFSYRITTHSLI